MRLTRKQTICDIPILKIRDYFDHIRPALISPEMISEQFDLNKEKTKELIDPLNKEKADKLFKEFMERVEEINSNEFYLYRVSKIVLFGSYIDPEKTDYSDIDIAFELSRKAKSHEEFMEMDEQRIKEAELAGKSFPSFFDQIGYTERVVLLKMKNKCRYISLHRMYDGILNITKTKQVYP